MRTITRPQRRALLGVVHDILNPQGITRVSGGCQFEQTNWGEAPGVPTVNSDQPTIAVERGVPLFVVEKGIPIPPRTSGKRKRASILPHNSMAVGDSFLLPKAWIKAQYKGGKLSVSWLAGKTNKHFCYRHLPNGDARVWRTK